MSLISKDFLIMQLKTLEIAFGREMLRATEKVNLWYEKFRWVEEDDFEAAANWCMDHLERFPSIASFVKALKEVGGTKKDLLKLKVVIPYVFYRDILGRSFVLVNKTGRCESPPERIDREDGTFLIGEEEYKSHKEYGSGRVHKVFRENRRS